MPGYNDYGNYGNYGAYGTNNGPLQPPNVRSVVPTNTGAYSYNSGYNGYQNPQPTPVRDNHWIYRDYVTGRAGAEAYQMPNGVNEVLLFDNDTDRMFVKGYDNNGRPRILEDSDISTHIDPEPSPIQPSVDLSHYATKEDIQKMINDAIGGLSQTNLASYVTQTELTKALSELSVGNGGRIVRNNEPNA